MALSLDSVAGHGSRIEPQSPAVEAARLAVMPTPDHEVAYGLVVRELRRTPRLAVLLAMSLARGHQVRV